LNSDELKSQGPRVKHAVVTWCSEFEYSRTHVSVDSMHCWLKDKATPAAGYSRKKAQNDIKGSEEK
jgi:hypothetical protein